MRVESGTINVADLVNSAIGHDDFGSIVDLDAVGVTVVGPAVVFAGNGTSFTGCHWDSANGGAEAIVWEIDPVRTVIVGVVHLVRCSFVECTFVGIGYAGTPEMLSAFFRGSTTGR